MSQQELDAVIVANWVEMDAMSARRDEIADRIWRMFDEQVTAWAGENGWGVTSNYADDNGECTLAPPEWVDAGSEDGASMWFEFGLGSEQQAYSLITNLLGEHQTPMMFWLDASGWIKGKVDRRKAFARFDVDAGAPEFSLDESGDGLVLPIKLDRSLLTDALDGEWEAFFSPLRDALDAMKAAAPIFDAHFRPLRTT